LETELGRIVPLIIASGAKKIIIFGSLARGKPHKSSDIDLIVIEETEEGFLERLDRYYTTLRPQCKIDFFVYTPREFEEMKEKNSFIRSAVKEGLVVYEAWSWRGGIPAGAFDENDARRALELAREIIEFVKLKGGFGNWGRFHGDSNIREDSVLSPHGQVI
jgi:predicted nucleotidyltransferase